MGDARVNMATVPRRTGHAYPVRRTVPGVLRDSGVAGFTVATPRRTAVRWVQTFVGTVWTALWGAGFLESAFSRPASRSRPSRGFLHEG